MLKQFPYELGVCIFFFSVPKKHPEMINLKAVISLLKKKVDKKNMNLNYLCVHSSEWLRIFPWSLRHCSNPSSCECVHILGTPKVRVTSFRACPFEGKDETSEYDP
jgi:hypothetical protein